MAMPSRQKIKKPSVLRAYWHLTSHFEYLRQKEHTCSHCYAKDNSLVIQGDVNAHIIEICKDIKTIDLSNITDDMQDYQLVDCINLRDDIFELKLRHNKKGRVA